MSIHAITEHHLIHTCPGNPDPHPVAIARTIVHTTPGRPCAAPVTIRIGDTVVTVACGRHQPADRQCGNCRTLLHTVSITVTDLGHQAPTGHVCVPTAAPVPCPSCQRPMAAHLDRHILCPPAVARSRTTA